MLTTVLVASCVLTAGLFVVVAGWMQDQGYRRAAAANLGAAVCCLLGAVVMPSGSQAVPFATLVAATLLGATSLHAVRIGRG